MSKDIEIKDPMALFSSNADDLLGFVSYEGTIGKHVPVSLNIDAEAKTMSVVFENAQEEKICDLSPENIEAVNRIYEEMRANKKSIMMGFYAVDSEQQLTNPCYNVPVLVIPR